MRFAADAAMVISLPHNTTVGSIETLGRVASWETTGMVALQAESEIAAINMVYGGAGSGKMAMT